MNRSLRSLLSAAAAVMALVPVLASAQSAPLATPDQVRAKFADAGYQVDAPTTWWTNGSTTFLVHDATGSISDGRVLMVLVYPDLTTAQADSERDELVPGYGPSVFQGNVAMVESTWMELNRQYEAQLATDLGTTIAIGRSTNDQPQPSKIAATTRVDADFLAAFNQGAGAANF
jgi:hypothetical protein